MRVRTGQRLKSVVCSTELVVVSGDADVDLRCGGASMVELDAPATDGVELDGAFADGTEIGKRYVDEDSGIELLCTKAGGGSVSIAERALPLKGATALPASD